MDDSKKGLKTLIDQIEGDDPCAELDELEQAAQDCLKRWSRGELSEEELFEEEILDTITDLPDDKWASFMWWASQVRPSAPN